MNALPITQIPLTASGNVRTHRFVKMTGEGAGGETALQGDRPIGVTCGFTDRFPSDERYTGTVADTVLNGAPLCAVSGRGIPYFGIPGTICEILAGTGGVTAGAELTNEITTAGFAYAGAAVVATASDPGVWVAGRALRAASAGELVPMILLAPYQLQTTTA